MRRKIKLLVRVYLVMLLLLVLADVSLNAEIHFELPTFSNIILSDGTNEQVGELLALRNHQ